MRPSNTHKSHKKNSLASESNLILNPDLRFNFDPIHETDRNPCNLRVVQPHLLYALGIHPEISSEKVAMPSSRLSAVKDSLENMARFSKS